ncbi:hypothetical protein niasHS_012832 [Heterodera schachtii]|uniref:Uncharacterized protein n=1 Tax=Heterodera schachtii TaxID=97005 RepID=A0ABD2IF97_HETSC
MVTKFYFDEKSSQSNGFKLENMVKNSNIPIEEFEQIFKVSNNEKVEASIKTDNEEEALINEDNEGGKEAINGERKMIKGKFGEKLKEILEMVQEKAIKEKGKLKNMKEAMKENSSEDSDEMKEKKKRLLSDETATFDDRFGTLLNSPFMAQKIAVD